MDPSVQNLLADTIRVCLNPQAQITHTVALPFSQHGYSGAELSLFEVQFLEGLKCTKTVSLLVKQALLNERRAMTVLFQQGQAVIPFCYTPDLSTYAPAPICMQYIQTDAEDPGKDFLRQIAEKLAAIHCTNLGNRDLLAWAQPADKNFFAGSYVLETWRNGWSRCQTDPDFVEEYGAWQSPLEAAAVDFLTAMDQLWLEGDTLTLVHADLHDENILAKDGNPYIVDWEQAHYGSFYIDLPNVLSREEIPFYREALEQLGYSVSPDVFLEHYRQAGRYVGFKYMAFVMTGWPDRDQPGSMVRSHLNNLIHLAVNGA
jgi:hypothetical protein